jgi:CHAT domain-containing protein/tetratricopeptide (TPR) repeat protein
MKSAVESARLSEYEKSIKLFSEAKKLFDHSGASQEARFADLWVGNCYLRTDAERSLKILEPLSQTFERKQYRWLLAQSLNSLSDAESSKRNFSKTLEYSTRSLNISKAIDDSEMMLRNMQLPVSMHQQFGDYAKSLGLILTAFDFARDLYLQPQDLWTFYHQSAFNLYSLNFTAPALEFQEKALKLATESGMPLLKSRSLALLGLIYQKAGNFEQAISSVQLALAQAEKIAGEKSRSNLIANSTLSLAHIYRESKQFKSALDCYDQAIELHKRLNLDIYGFQAHKGKLLTLVEMDDIPKLTQEIDTSVTLIEQYRPKIQEERNRNGFFDLAQSIYDIAVDVTYSRRGDRPAAFNYSEASQARSLLDMSSANTQVIDEADHPDIKLPSVAPPLELSDIQKSLPEQSQILQYSVLENKLIAWVVFKGGFESKVQDIKAGELSDKVTGFFESVSRKRRKSNEETIARAKELYDILISPVRASLDSRKQLCIVPDKVLNYVPFNALVSPDSNKYFIEEYSLEIAPSSSVFIACSNRAAGKEAIQNERLLSVGDPSFDGELFPSLNRLPSAAAEAAEVSRCYGASLTLLGENASKKQIKPEMAKANVMHFAAHYVTDERWPMLSKLLLAKDQTQGGQARNSGSFLHAYEIYNMKLPQCRLVVLSACRTGIEQSYQGEGAIGFARPFLQAEVPLVVASLWPIETTSASRVMIDFHKRRKQGPTSTVEALRQAQLELLKDANSGFQDPYFWAPFTVIGGYARY